MVQPTSAADTIIVLFTRLTVDNKSVVKILFGMTSTIDFVTRIAIERRFFEFVDVSDKFNVLVAEILYGGCAGDNVGPLVLRDRLQVI